MLTICAWCKAVMVEGDDAIPSHGICQPCAAKWIEPAIAREAQR